MNQMQKLLFNKKIKRQEEAVIRITRVTRDLQSKKLKKD